MMKKYLKKISGRLGYTITKKNPNPLQDDNPLNAVKDFFNGSEAIFFDIGMNYGQTTSKMRSFYPTAVIHGFEPSKKCFHHIKENLKTENVFLYHKAVGSENSFLEFNEYSWSALNSLLKRSFTQSKIEETYQVEVITVDSVCKDNQIPYINFLKTDTEGYELEVLKGASEMMRNNKVQFVFVEIFFKENFIGQSSFGDIYNFLQAHNFDLVRFYEMEIAGEGIANRTDALFINRAFNSEATANKK